MVRLIQNQCIYILVSLIVDLLYFIILLNIFCELNFVFSINKFFKYHSDS